MAYRFSWLAGAGALIYLLYQLGELLTASDEGTPWPVVVGAALVLSIAITWIALANRASTWLVVVANAIAAAAAVTWTAAPGTTRAVLPTGDTMSALHEEVSRAIDVLRSGVEPVFPFPGLLALLLVLFWIVGSVLAWGLFRGRPHIALLPPLIIALQFATIDRDPATLQGSALFVSIVAACLLAIAVDRRQGTARMAAAGEFGATKLKLPRASAGLVAFTVVAAIVVGSVFGGLVPANGLLNWRSTPGPGEGSPTAYNAFISIRQRLVSASDTPVFTARIHGEVPIDQIYFSLVTMENYDGEQFSPSAEGAARLDDEAWLDREQQFAGPVERVTSEVEIRQLSMAWLPSVATPVGFATDDRTLRSAVGISPDDGSLQIRGGLTTPGMEYRVTSDVPRPDMGALAWSGATLSPVFREAERAGETVPEQTPIPVHREPPDGGRYLALPADLDRRIETRARLETINLTTSFERAIALETWFRDEFEYSTDIEPGHGATDLASWLLDPESPNYRRGYCENFATSMAVMARTLDIPSRVVLGFTPGVPQPDGSIVVLDRNAHAWVELWMPTQGWVRFDPTPRGDQVNPPTLEAVEAQLGFTIRDYLDVPDPAGPGNTEPPPPTSTPPTTTLPPNSDPAEPGGFEMSGGMPVLAWMAVAALALGGVPTLKWLRRRRLLRRLRTGDISAAWDEIVIRLDDLGTPPNAADTPSEVASKVDPAMEPLAAVYSRSLYGEVAVVPRELVTMATASLSLTERRLTECHSRAERLLAGYRIRTLLPRQWRRPRR